VSTNPLVTRSRARRDAINASDKAAATALAAKRTAWHAAHIGGGSGVPAQAGGGGQVDPQSIPNLFRQYDATTIPPQTDNTRLDNWAAKFGGGSMGSSVGQGPRYRTAGINGRPGMEWNQDNFPDAYNMVETVGPPGANGWTELTLFFVAKRISGQQLTDILFWGGAANDDTQVNIHIESPHAPNHEWGLEAGLHTSFVNADDIGTVAAKVLTAVIGTKSGTNCPIILRTNGVQKVSGAIVMAAGATILSNFALGAGAFSVLRTVIGEALLYTRKLTALEITAVEGYLTAKWGIA